MSKISVQKTQIFIFVLTLIFASIACNRPDNVEKEVGESKGVVVEDCYPVDRSEYEYEAARLGETPETPKYPESAVPEFAESMYDIGG